MKYETTYRVRLTARLKMTTIFVACFSAPLIAVTGAAIAQNASQQTAGTNSGEIEEVVVTAMRTSSLASKTPVSLTAVSGEDLTKMGVQTPTDLNIPNVSFAQFASAMQITIRGVTSTDATEKGDPSAAFMQDGIYIARPDIQNLGFFDINRVEVLRGPQGTLYGRNTTAGVVNVISNEPNWDREGSLKVTVGDYNARVVEGMYNLPVTDYLSLRGAFVYNYHDSHIINGQGTIFDMPDNRDDISMRLSAKIMFSDDAVLVLRGDASQIHTHYGQTLSSVFYSNELSNPVWLGPNSKAARTYSFVPTLGTSQSAPMEPENDDSTWGIGANFNWNLGPVTLTYDGSHRILNRRFAASEAYGAAPGFYIGTRSFFDGAYQQDSHELRVALNDTGPLKAQAGLYYFKEMGDIILRDADIAGLFGMPAYNYYAFPQNDVKNISRAAFAQLTYEIIKGVRLTAGVRYSEDHKTRFGATTFQMGLNYDPLTDVASLNDASLKGSKVIWRAGVDADVTDNTLWYGTVSTGYKAGGFNDGCLAGSSNMYFGHLLTCSGSNVMPASLLFYKPEQLLSYETGIKTKFWDNRVMLNADVFYYDYTNLQLSGTATLGGAPVQITRNAADATVMGFELEGAVAPTDTDRITYSLTLLDAKYGHYTPLPGHIWDKLVLDRSPTWAFNLGYEKTVPIGNAGLTFGLSTKWSGNYIDSSPAQALRFKIPSYHVSNFNITYRPNSSVWSVQAFVKNIEDKVIPVTVSGNGTVNTSDPRTIGVRMQVNF